LTEETHIHPTAEVSPEAKVGPGTKVWHQAQVREEAKVGKNCILAKGVYIDKGVRIGNRVKVENYVSVYQGVTIEDDVIIGSQVSFTNDLYPRAFNQDWELLKTSVKKGASIGANATIICGLTVGRYALVGAGSVVTHNVPDYGLVFGNPAKLKGFVSKCGQKLGRGQKEDNVVRMKCTKCGEVVEIPKNIYALVEK